MPARKFDTVSMDDPLALIRSRIRERRLYEARFLYRQLGDGIGARERMALEGEITGLLQRVGDLHRQARVAAAAGQRQEALRLYGELEAIALDVPGLAEEKRALAGAAALMAKIAVAAPEPAPPVMPPPANPVEERLDEPPVASLLPRRHQSRRWLWLAAGLMGLGLLLVVVFWRSGTNDSPPSPSPTSPPGHSILIRPLVADAPAIPPQPVEEAPSTVAEQPAEPESPPESPPAPPVAEPAAKSVERAPEPAVPPSSSPLELGTLHLKAFGKKK